MLKSMLAGAIALVIAGSSLVYAQQDPASSGPGERESRARMTAEDFQAFTNAHIAALKTGLGLSADQEKNWPPIETAIRDLAKRRQARVAERRERMSERRNDQGQQRDALDLLRRRADAMTERAAGLKRLADAAEPLYKSLDDGQKRRLTMLSWSMRPGNHGHGGMGRREPGRPQ
jgi:hypothetical protein